MKVAEIIVKIMEKEGIVDAFGIPGAGINPVYKYLGDSEIIKHYLVRHEEAAVHAADGYARSSGKLAVALCTSGPGATNFVTGIYTANIDSIPLLAITGQNMSSLLGKDAFQCVDIAQICKPIAKATYCVLEAAKVPEVMKEAIYLARSGKPGAVLVDLPLDIQMTDIDYDIDTYIPEMYVKPEPNPEDIKCAVDLLLNATNPIMIMGGGVILSGAEKECIQFAENLNLPIITTYMAKGGVPVDHPLNVGHMGIQCGGPLGNKVFLESDVVLGIGCRFTDRHTGNVAVYKGNRTFIHIDIEPTQINKIIKTEVGIVADAKLALVALLKDYQSRNEKSKESDLYLSLPSMKENLERSTYFEQTPIKPQRVFHEINRLFDDTTLFTTGCGVNQIWSGQFQKINKSRKYLPSGGAGTLGFDIPAAIGASIGAPGNKIVAVMGDFGFTFMVEELAVASSYNIPLIVIILNNAYLGLIRQNQVKAYQYEYAVSIEENHTVMDYVKVAEGFGCSGERVFDPKEIVNAIQRAKDSKKPYIIDIIVERETDCSMGPDVASVVEFE